MITGCFGNGSETNAVNQTPASEETDTPEEADTPEQTATPEEESVFADYGIEETELSVELTEDALGQVVQIRLETPSEEKFTEVSETITEYSLDVLRDRAGTWFIDALNDNEEVIETVELETTFDVSVDGIGTLAQLGVTGRSSAFEQVDFQLTINNTGSVPIEPSRIEIVVPEFEFEVDTIPRTGDIEDDDGLVDRDGELTIIAGSDNTYRYEYTGSTTAVYRSVLMFTEERANEVAGQSFQGEFVISYQAERDDTVVPITIEIGDNVITDSDITSRNLAHLQGTRINKR